MRLSLRDNFDITLKVESRHRPFQIPMLVDKQFFPYVAMKLKILIHPTTFHYIIKFNITYNLWSFTLKFFVLILFAHFICSMIFISQSFTNAQKLTLSVILTFQYNTSAFLEIHVCLNVDIKTNNVGV